MFLNVLPSEFVVGFVLPLGQPPDLADVAEGVPEEVGSVPLGFHGPRGTAGREGGPAGGGEQRGGQAPRGGLVGAPEDVRQGQAGVRADHPESPGSGLKQEHFRGDRARFGGIPMDLLWRGGGAKYWKVLKGGRDRACERLGRERNSSGLMGLSPVGSFRGNWGLKVFMLKSTEIKWSKTAFFSSF